MTRTLSLAAGLAVLLSSSPVWAQGTGAVQPGNPPAPQQGIGTAAPSAPKSTGSPDAAQPMGAGAPTTSSSAASGASSGAAAKLSGADKTFVQKATQGGMAEIQAGQLAEDQAQSPEVKAFGQHMVTDHTAAGQKLKSIADDEGVKAPADLSASDKKQLASLQKLNGRSFDRQYVKEQLAAHKSTVALFKKEAASGQDAQLKQFASDTLPTLEQHLTEVQGLMKK